ncbi:hypothetical protein MLD38_001882 [Melastoma candidum]|uniref:Uncharacterized protein n=1 Tax=Melastoma candidum TaxID=119954 RepID=A0ACB9SGM7_9MYRT|nr:hypothetical protein MLD38_001882 [Melastoma candidum]
MGGGILKKVLCCGRKSFSSSSGEVAEGHVKVRVGGDLGSKFEMMVNYLNHPLFESLLRAYSEEEFGFSYAGALRIPCEVGLFRYLIYLLETGGPFRSLHGALGPRVEVSCHTIVVWRTVLDPLGRPTC